MAHIDYDIKSKSDLYIDNNCIFYAKDNKIFLTKLQRTVADAILTALYAAKKRELNKREYFTGVTALKKYVEEELKTNVKGVNFRTVVGDLHPLFLKLNRRGSMALQNQGHHSFYEVKLTSEGEKVIEELKRRYEKHGGNENETNL